MLVSAIHQHESVVGIHIFPPSWTSLYLQPPTPSYPSRLSQSPVRAPASCSKFPLAIYFTYDNIYVSMLVCQLAPSSPSPAVSTGLFSIAALQIGSSDPSFFQARVLEWVAISFSRGSSQPRVWSQVFHIVGRCFTVWATREVLYMCSVQFSHSVVSNFLRPRGLQYTRLFCPSPTPRAYSNSCPKSWWCDPTISSSTIPFSFLEFFPDSGSF